LENELEKIVQLRNGLVTISDKIEKTELSKKDLEEEIHLLKEKNTAKKIEIDNELRNKDRLDQELKEQRVVVTIKSQEVIGRQEAVNKATEDISVIESQIRLQKQMIEKLKRDQDSLGIRTVKLQ
jgi:phage I-like protein